MLLFNVFGVTIIDIIIRQNMYQILNSCLSSRILTDLELTLKISHMGVSIASQYLNPKSKTLTLQNEVSTKYSRIFHYHYLVKSACMIYDFTKSFSNLLHNKYN